MNDCLSTEELELLNERPRRAGGAGGRGLFSLLKHLESCDKCSSLIRMPTKEEIMKRLEEDEILPSPVSKPSKSASSVRQKK